MRFSYQIINYNCKNGDPMESRSIKIKDYVTHERVPVRGDSHGNFTLSPLGFPFVNRSGYVPGGVPPTTFNMNMLVKPDLTANESDISAILEYKDAFKFPRTDSDHDTFIVKATLVAGSEGYTIQTDSATFFKNAIVTVSVDDLTYEAVNGDYTVTGDNYIETEPQSGIPEEGISCSVTFRPELTRDAGVDPLFIKFTGSGDNNGVYKLIVDEDDNGILHYTWMYKTSVQDSCESQELPVEFDETMNDNVHDHYRNRFSDQEVADYITHVLGAAVECGKFRGAEYPVDAHGLLVKWFLSRGAIVHSVAGKTVVLDGFGHVLSSSDIGDCSGTPTQDEEHDSYNIGPMNSWLMSTAGENDYEDYPNDELSGSNNNISIKVEQSGERHTFVIQQDLSDMVNTPPRKTFIHLPTELDLADGTEVELNVALPVVSQPDPDVGSSEEAVKEAIKSYTDFVSQPRVYILSGKQTSLPNNAVLDSGIETGADSFSFRTRHPIDVDDGSKIAFGLLNRFECPKTFHFIGDVEVTVLNDGVFLNGDRSKILFDENIASIPLNKGDYLSLQADVTTPIIGKVIEVLDAAVVVDFGRELGKPYGSPDYEVYHNGDNCNASLVEGTAPTYQVDVDGVDEGDLVEFEVVEVHTEEKRIVSIVESGDDDTIVTLSSPFTFEPDVEIHGVATKITVDGIFPYNRSSRRWTMYSKDATCMVDVRTVDAQGGLTEHTEDSGAFNNDTSTEPELVDNDSIIATIYPTSTNTFPWRLNGRNRVRHLGLVTGANIDYNTTTKPLTRLIFEMNKKVYDGLRGMFRGYTPMSELRYADDLDDSAEGHSVIGTLLRVTLPATLDADVDDENKDSMHVVSTATKAFHNLIGDFKVARVGYESSRGYPNKENSTWGYDGDDTPSLDIQGSDNLQRLNDWETKILHLPNYCLGVGEGPTLERNLAYAGWNEYTHTNNFRIFYASDVDPFVDSNGYIVPDSREVNIQNTVGNIRYASFKDASGTTQRTIDKYMDEADGDVPFNYTAENSVFKLFLTNPDEKTLNQYGALIHGLLDLPIIKRGLKSISWLDIDSEETDALKRECEFVSREMEPFYPSSHVLSTDGVAFPAVDRASLCSLAQSTDDDVKRALLAFPDKVAIYNDRTAKELAAELISVNLPNVFDDPAINYMKSLLTMYSNGMPLHMYDAHRAINVDTPSDDYEDLLYAHEIGLYNRNASLDMQKQHRYCDLAHNSTDGQGSEDVNMTYNFISGDGIDPTAAPMPLTTPLENVSADFIEKVFGPDEEKTHTGMYTRVHVKAMFSSSLGRWIVKDYRQYPTCYLTPLYGAKTIDYTKKSYSYGNPAKYENRVPMSEGNTKSGFNILTYIGACEEQPLWQLPCGVGTDYRDAMYSRYVDQPVMEMNPGCVPFMLETFPYGNDGKLNGSIKFRNLYESIMTPMDANGEPKEGAVPEVNFWNIKLNIRPARSAYPGADIPSNSARTGGTIAEPTLGMFNDPI